jgi:hypothetical protein
MRLRTRVRAYTRVYARMCECARAYVCVGARACVKEFDHRASGGGPP